MKESKGMNEVDTDTLANYVMQTMRPGEMHFHFLDSQFRVWSAFRNADDFVAVQPDEGWALVFSLAE